MGLGAGWRPEVPRGDIRRPDLMPGPPPRLGGTQPLWDARADPSRRSSWVHSAGALAGDKPPLPPSVPGLSFGGGVGLETDEFSPPGASGGFKCPPKKPGVPRERPHRTSLYKSGSGASTARETHKRVGSQPAPSRWTSAAHYDQSAWLEEDSVGDHPGGPNGSQHEHKAKG